jgi:L-galactose dehydrogenase
MLQRPFGSKFDNERLPASVSIVGLGCSSFSTFFWTKDEHTSHTSKSSKDAWAVEGLQREHPRVQEWIQTITYAVTTAGVTLLDTAPWYGHGTSEVVIGWALQALANHSGFQREGLTINTKVGRYEAEPARQFDFSATATLASVQRSLARMQCEYIDVLQLHDPEFAPSLDILIHETIPAMLQCQEQGWCRALGMTGYPLHVQHQILERSLQAFGRNIWDVSLTYGHYNLHNSGLLDRPISTMHASFADYCAEHNMLLLAAAPLSMGLLTHREAPPAWHPASADLKVAGAQAAAICQEHGVDLATLALLFALSQPRSLPCTLLGMSTVQEVQTVHALAERFRRVTPDESPDEVLAHVLTANERLALDAIRNRTVGPFASLWKEDGSHRWDGLAEARLFWKQLAATHEAVDWQAEESIHKV